MAHRTLAAGAAALLMTLTPLSVWAAGTATIQTGSDDSTMAWLDSNTVRFNPPMAQGSYMIAREGKIYMVNPAASGMPQVMEMGDMMQGFAKMGQAQNPSILDTRIQSVKATGKTETIAGMKGEVYQVTTVDGKGQTKTAEAVFTNNPLAVEMTAAFLSFSASMAGKDNVAKFKDALPKGKHGLLRMGSDMVVKSISKDALAASEFELPGKPVNMGNLMKGLMEQIQKHQ